MLTHAPESFNSQFQSHPLVSSRDRSPHWKGKEGKNPVGLGLAVSDRGLRAFAVEVAYGTVPFHVAIPRLVSPYKAYYTKSIPRFILPRCSHLLSNTSSQ